MGAGGWAATLFLCAALEAQGPPPVQDLTCVCQPAPEGFVAQLTWVNAGAYQSIAIFRDGSPAGNVPGGLTQFTDPGPGPGAHHYDVIAIDARGDASLPATCAVQCGGAPSPSAVIQGPSRLVFPPATFVEAIYDGRASRDGRGGQALRYRWSSSFPGVQIVASASPATAVRFPGPGDFILGLEVLGAPDFGVPSLVSFQVTVVSPDDLPLEAPALLPPPPDLVAAVADGERPFELALPLGAGAPWPELRLVSGPAWLQLDALGGRLFGVPPRRGGGNQLIEVEVEAANGAGGGAAVFPIEVLDPGVPIVLYAFPLPGGGGDKGHGGGANGDGGGAAIGPAPDPLADQSPIPLPLPLNVVSLSASDRGVVGVSGEPFDGVRQIAGCAASPDCAAGAYSSLSPAAKVPANITNDFSIELWVASRSNPTPAGAESTIFTMADAGGTGFAVVFLGGGSFRFDVNTTAGLVSTTVPTGRGLDTPVHLVFVRQGLEHLVYVDGELSLSVPVAAGAPSFLATQPLYLFDDPLGAQPYFGTVYLAAIYGEAYSAEAARVLFDLGPEVPDPAAIPAPRAEICPDPREIRRSVLEADGSESRAFAGGAGGGVGGGAGGPGVATPAARGGGGAEEQGGGAAVACSGLLRPFDWSWSTSPLPPAGTVLSGACGGPVTPGAIACTPSAGQADCLRKVEIAYDPLLAGGPSYHLTLQLLVTQVPIRGVVLTDTACKRLELPLRPFIRGDSNRDGSTDISDGIFILLWLFGGAGHLPCPVAADVNKSGVIDISDAKYLLDSLFSGGPPPLPPYPVAGEFGDFYPTELRADLRYCDVRNEDC